MSVFRVEKTQNYTVMSNHHLRNAALSLKAKGLLSQMLSLPETWDYTLKGLSQINRESLDAIRSAVQELERAGYITRTRERKENGQLGGAEYVIREQPPEGFTPGGGSQGGGDSPGNAPNPLKSAIPALHKPTSGNPTQANATLGNATQLNKDKAINDLRTTDLQTHSVPIASPRPATANGQTPERKGTEAAATSAAELYREILHENIDYPLLLEKYAATREQLDGIVDLALETLCATRKTIRVAGDDYPAELVKAKFLKLNYTHIEFVLDCMAQNTTAIRNIKQYLLAVLFNAPSTIGSYYSALVNHHMAQGAAAWTA